MNTNKTISFALSFILSITLAQAFSVRDVRAITNTYTKNILRIQGLDRFKTSRAIAEEITSTAILENIVIASGYDFPDGLSGSTLSKKLNAPLLMAGNLSDSKEAIDYISTHLIKNGNVYILGGTGVVSKDTEDILINKGFNVKRVFGQDRFETNNSIINSIAPLEGTPVFISNAYGFADALSASSIAAIKGYPLLLTQTNEIPNIIKNQLSKIKPSKVYIVGGTGVITSTVETQIKELLPLAEIIRLAGVNRYETSMNLYKHFNLDSKNILLVSGRDFPDALCGSQLAAKLNTSMVLCDEDNLDSQQGEFNKKNIENFYLLGGTGALTSDVEQSISFNREAEIANIKALFSTAAQAVRLKDINQYMSVIDKTSPAYDITKEVYIDLFQYCNEYDLDIIPRFDSFDFTSINYKEAVVKVIETDAITNNYEKTTEYVTATTTSNLKKINGQWKFSTTTATNITE